MGIAPGDVGRDGLGLPDDPSVLAICGVGAGRNAIALTAQRLLISTDCFGDQAVLGNAGADELDPTRRMTRERRAPIVFEPATTTASGQRAPNARRPRNEIDVDCVQTAHGCLSRNSSL